MTAHLLAVSIALLTGVGAASACPIDTPSDDPAVERMRVALVAHPDRPRLWSGFADSLLNADALEAAEACADTAVERWPELAGAHLIRGRVAIARGDMEAAETHLEVAEKTGPLVVRQAVARARRGLGRGSNEGRWRVRAQFSAHHDDRADAVAGPFGLADDTDPAAFRLGVAVRADRYASGWRAGAEVGRTLHLGFDEASGLDRTRITGRLARIDTSRARRGWIPSVLDLEVTGVLAGHGATPHVGSASIGGIWARVGHPLWASLRFGGLLLAESVRTDDTAVAGWGSAEAGLGVPAGPFRFDGRTYVHARYPGGGSLTDLGVELAPGVGSGPWSVGVITHISWRYSEDEEWGGIMGAGLRAGARSQRVRVDIDLLQQSVGAADFGGGDRIERTVFGGRVTVLW